jgi:hypothetical protein
VRTLTTLRASSSLAVLRDTRMILAPFAASCVATDRPMPSEAPVMRIVWMEEYLAGCKWEYSAQMN